MTHTHNNNNNNNNNNKTNRISLVDIAIDWRIISHSSTGGKNIVFAIQKSS
jgi:hypothetical protein